MQAELACYLAQIILLNPDCFSNFFVNMLNAVAFFCPEYYKFRSVSNVPSQLRKSGLSVMTDGNGSGTL